MFGWFVLCTAVILGGAVWGVIGSGSGRGPVRIVTYEEPDDDLEDEDEDCDPDSLQWDGPEEDDDDVPYGGGRAAL